MFKPANPDSRIPAYLQSYTKENLVAQLAAVAVLVAGVTLVEEVSIRRSVKRRLAQENPKK